MNDNFISANVEKIVLDILQKNKTLVEFNVSGNRLSASSQKKNKAYVTKK